MSISTSISSTHLHKCLVKGEGTEAQRVCVLWLAQLSVVELRIEPGSKLTVCQTLEFSVDLNPGCIEGHRLESLSYWTFFLPAGRDSRSVSKVPPKSGSAINSILLTDNKEKLSQLCPGHCTIVSVCGVVTYLPHVSPDSEARGSWSRKGSIWGNNIFSSGWPVVTSFSVCLSQLLSFFGGKWVA